MFVGELISAFKLFLECKRESLDVAIHEPEIRYCNDPENHIMYFRLDVTIENTSALKIVVSSARMSWDRRRYYDALHHCPIQWNSPTVHQNRCLCLLPSTVDPLAELPVEIPPNSLRRISVWVQTPDKDEFLSLLLQAAGSLHVPGCAAANADAQNSTSMSRCTSARTGWASIFRRSGRPDRRRKDTCTALHMFFRVGRRDVPALVRFSKNSFPL